VGAHLGEESDVYEILLSGTSGMTYWVESQSSKCEMLRENLDPSRNMVINSTIWSEANKKMIFNETNNSESSSLLSLNIHSDIYPDIFVEYKREVITNRLDNLVGEFKFNFINLDIQGAELEALKSLGSYITKIDWIYTEVNIVELYNGCALVTDIDEFLKIHGFTRMGTRWLPNAGWGDAIYFKNSHVNNRVKVIFLISSFRWKLTLLSRYIRAKLPNSARKFLRNIHKGQFNKQVR
jgi:FkbM family methyltransferase